MKLTIREQPANYVREENWEEGRPVDGVIPPGTEVEYDGHLPGGMVLVTYAGQKVVIHPGSTVELEG